MVAGIVRHTGFDRHLCFGLQWPADERFEDVSTDGPQRIEHRQRLHNGNGSVCRTRVERTLHRLVKALEEPSGIVQDAVTVCDNPTRSRVQWSDRSPRDRREANLYISARTEQYTAMTFTPAPTNRWLRHRVPGGPERYHGLAAWKADHSREENRLTAKTTAKYDSSQPNFVPTDVGLWHISPVRIISRLFRC